MCLGCQFFSTSEAPLIVMTQDFDSEEVTPGYQLQETTSQELSEADQTRTSLEQLEPSDENIWLPNT